MKRLTFLIGCLIFLCVPSAETTAQERASADAAALNHTTAEPLKIKPFALKKSGWLNQPVLEVENVSGKVVEYLVVEINVPGAESSVMLAYGRVPGRDPQSQQAAALRPGAKVKLSVGRNACDEVKSRLLAGGASPSSGGRVTAAINGVVFEGGTAWFDGLPHVADPDNPLRWNVVEQSPARADVSYAPLFQMARVGYGVGPVRAPARNMCWKRMGTEWVDCCGLPRASAILMQMWGGIYEPHPMTQECGDGSYCEWIKQLGCSTDPQG